MPEKKKVKIYSRFGAFMLGIVCYVARIVFVIAVFLFIGLPLSMLSDGKEYVTTDIADYGEYKGNYDNKTPTKMISGFFPEEINPAFQDVTYSYHAMTGDSYAFEAYLEFTIEDKDAFADYVSSITDNENWQTFMYDDDFLEYRISDEYRFNSSKGEPADKQRFGIEYAKICKVLISHSKQQVIYVALGVYDGGYTRCSYLTCYFDRFGIDFVDYGNHRSMGL